MFLLSLLWLRPLRTRRTAALVGTLDVLLNWVDPGGRCRNVEQVSRQERGCEVKVFG